MGCLGLVAAAPAGPQDPGPIVNRAAQIYRGLTSLQADFVQTIADRGLGDTLTSRGTVVQAGANYFAMRFSDPPGEAVVVDGKYVWIYTPSTQPKQVTRMALATDPIYGVNILAKILDRPRERYQLRLLKSDEVGGRPAHVVELVPNSPDADFTRAVVWFDEQDGLRDRVEFDEGRNARRTFVLSKLRPNVAYTKETFKFDVPSGVKVIDRS
ncbi:MAG: outer membrane lipoprotein carrier protein LolA [Gemmatimonadota bacterium]